MSDQAAHTSTVLLDTHQHLIYPERYTYEWAEGIPALSGRPFHLNRYRDAASGCGIASSVFMETVTADPSENDETAFVSALAVDPANAIDGIVACCRPERDDFPAWLERLETSRVVGLRRVLHVEPDDLSRRPLVRENIRRLPSHGLTFDLCVLARQLPLAIELAEACPETAFVLDHCGVPDIAGDALDPWRDQIVRIAALPNVACKLSGLLAYCEPGRATLDAVRPYAEHCLASFGWDRMVWGSDWPLVEITSTLAEWVSITRELVSGEPEENQRLLFHENARRIYHLGHDHA